MTGIDDITTINTSKMVFLIEYALKHLQAVFSASLTMLMIKAEVLALRLFF